jgi:predicted NUDIX family NTP pyrophosphohydrolase
MTISKPERSSSKISAGILAYRERADGLEVLLVHPGGPYWRNKDAGAWSIPKGEIDGPQRSDRGMRSELFRKLSPGCALWILFDAGRDQPARREVCNRVFREE